MESKNCTAANRAPTNCSAWFAVDEDTEWMHQRNKSESAELIWALSSSSSPSSDDDRLEVVVVEKEDGKKGNQRSGVVVL